MNEDDFYFYIGWNSINRGQTNIEEFCFSNISFGSYAEANKAR